MPQREDGLDLGYLSDDQPEEAPPKPYKSREVISEGRLGKDFYDKPKNKYQGSKSVGKVGMGLAELSTSMQPAPQAQDIEMSTVDVKCNYAKDRVEVLCGGKLILKFDKDGICKMPTHKMPLLKQVQRARPGRFKVVVPAAPEAPKVEVVPEAPEAPKVEETPALLAAVVEEAVSQLKSEDKPAKKAKNKAVPKRSKKKKGNAIKGTA